VTNTSQAGLLDLIRSGRLPVGTKLFHLARRHRERGVEAVVEVGGIRIGTNLYTSASAAAEAITGGPVNGWTFWRVRATGEQITNLRA